MTKRTIDQVDVRGRRVLVRVDFNLPLNSDGAIGDDRRLRAALSTVRSIVERGGRAVLMSHLGRPAGTGVEPAFSLRPIADHLAELAPDWKIVFAEDAVGPAATRVVAGLANGEIAVLENLRFYAGEKAGDESFAAGLAAHGDIYCNDAFGTAHRSDASMVAVPRLMADRPRVAGRLLARELEYLTDAVEDAERPFMAVLGGAKVSDKLGAIRNLLDKVDSILVGGAMAYTFLAARDIEMGDSLVESGMLETARSIMETGGDALVLPSDHICGQRLESGTPVKLCVGSIEPGWMGLDIGPATASAFGARLRGAKTIIWNGPVGVFEIPPFDAGSRSVATSIAAATAEGALSVIGGGDTAAAIEHFGLETQVSHVSTGGGASLQLLEGRAFESVALLEDAFATSRDA